MNFHLIASHPISYVTKQQFLNNYMHGCQSCGCISKCSNKLGTLQIYQHTIEFAKLPFKRVFLNSILHWHPTELNTSHVITLALLLFSNHCLENSSAPLRTQFTLSFQFKSLVFQVQLSSPINMLLTSLTHLSLITFYF